MSEDRLSNTQGFFTSIFCWGILSSCLTHCLPFTGDGLVDYKGSFQGEHISGEQLQMS